MKETTRTMVTALGLSWLVPALAFANTWDFDGVVADCDPFACGLIDLQTGEPIFGFLTADDAASGPNSTFGAADITNYGLAIQDVSVGPADSTIESATVTTDADGELAAGSIVFAGVVTDPIFGDIPLTLAIDLTAGTWSASTTFLGLGEVASGPGTWLLEPDGDDVGSIQDNCTLLANVDQRDTDVDGIGNRCDPDFDQNCSVNFSDLSTMKTNFFMPGDLVTDLDGNSLTNFADLLILKEFFFGAPGPSGLPNVCVP